MEGSPVLDESGVQVGYVAEARTGIERGLIRIAQPAAPPSLSTIATQYLADLTHAGPDSALRPGDSICLLTHWGDSTSTPQVGTVTSVDNGLVRCIVPDNTFGAGNRWPGPCLFALARAPVIAFARNNGEFEKVCAPGQIIGTVLEEDEHGLVAKLGVLPTTVELRVTYSIGDATLFACQSNIARDPQRLASWLEDGITNQLRCVIVPLDTSCTVALDMDGERYQEFEITGGFGSPWREVVARQVQLALSNGTAGITSVALAIKSNDAIDAVVGASPAPRWRSSAASNDWQPCEMHLESPAGYLDRVPVRCSQAHVVQGMRSSLVAWMEPGTASWWLRQSARGLSGTPVFNGQGAFVGAVWNSAGEEDPSLVLRAELIEGLLSQAKAVFPSVREASIDLRPHDLDPGECVGALYLWGASVGSAMFGVTSVVDHRAVVLLAHHVNAPTTGPRRLALCSAACLSAIPRTGGDAIEMVPGDVIGTVMADNPFGTVAIVGADPQGISLVIRREGSGAPSELQYWMARDPLYLPEALRDAVDHVSGFRQSEQWGWSGRCIGDDGSELTRTPAQERSIEELTRMVLDSFATYGDRVAAYEVVQSSR